LSDDERLRELRGRWLDSGSHLDHLAWLRERLRLSATDPLNDYREHVDPLTGVHQKRFVVERLEAALEVSSHVGVILIDVDWFMKINDRFGHGLADAVLSRLGRLLPSCVRSTTDTVGRYGGDEFLIVFQDAAPPRLEATAVRIRELVAEEVATAEIPVTVSMGLAFYEDDPGFVAADMLSRAEDASHQAKAAGRDRWVWGPISSR
jgi:diguanylate cyclase (GGDEF)-like protein